MTRAEGIIFSSSTFVILSNILLMFLIYIVYITSVFLSRYNAIRDITNNLPSDDYFD